MSSKSSATSETVNPALLKIWVSEQFDPCGILYSCIATCNEAQAQACQESFEENLSPSQREQGWTVQQRVVQSWDEVPVSALKLN